ncbi:MAG: hypothetical protein OXC48_03575, partial [Endozoicomonadaceae bacterium]|nr:hypothetical protein [Endozoicomonadaceae bacterium]
MIFLLILLSLFGCLNLFSFGVTFPVPPKNKNYSYQYKKIQPQEKRVFQGLSSVSKKATQLKNIVKENAGGNTSWSNAFNFKKIWGTQIDPRTGILSAHVKAGSLLSNLGHGPNI